MSEQGTARFELSKFVLDYLEEAGGVAMPPEFGIYDVLLPEELAAKLALADYVRLTFTAPGQPESTAPQQAPTDVVQLNITHTLVERMAQTLTQQPANAQSYIHGVRIDKRGLATLARTHYPLPNARIDEVAKSQEEASQHHYLLCNFKVTLVSEEKQEELVAIVMDVQAGHVVTDTTILQQLAIIDPEPTYLGLPIAQPRWSSTGDALAPATLQALLPRAEAALRQQLAPQVATLTTRMDRHLLLDLARIGDYYEEMTTDLERRRSRLAAEDQERRQGFDEKLAMLAAERAAKLADAQSRYKLRVEMQLLNVLLVTQPKVTLPVTISNRTATITRTVVWDPLTRRLEALVCDVCGQPGEGLHLCTGGHLAHTACLAPQCIDCKREFCRLCADQLSNCVVCGRPVCRPSLIKCPTCGRGTCNEHRLLCHAANGEPATLAEIAPTPPANTVNKPPTPQPAAPKTPVSPGAKSTATKTTGGKTPADPTQKGAPAGGTKTKLVPITPKSEPLVKGARLDIQIYTDRPVIIAFVMRSTNRVLASRSFELSPQGIAVNCECEKADCPVDGYVFRPNTPALLTKQILGMLTGLQQEYLVPAKKVKFLYQRFGQMEEGKTLVLPAQWLDPARLAEAQQGFDKLK